MTKVLVTGSNGFVGSHIVEELLNNKYEVICSVRQTSNLKWIKDLPISFKYGNLSDENFLKDCVKDVDVVVHCAGTVRAMNMAGYFESNVENTKKLCNAILNVNPALKKFIFISSQAAMGPSDSKTPKKLDAPANPVSDYGLSKIEAEKEIQTLLAGKIAYTILRPAAVYGPRDKDMTIFFDLVHKHLKLKTIKKRLVQLVFVKDIAKAVCISIKNFKSDNKVFYLAHSDTYTWENVGEIIAKGANRSTIPIIIPDFVFKLAGMIGQAVSYILNKPVVLNSQKITEMLQDYWIADTSPVKEVLGIDFTSLEIGSQITYNCHFKK